MLQLPQSSKPASHLTESAENKTHLYHTLAQTAKPLIRVPRCWQREHSPTLARRSADVQGPPDRGSTGAQLLPACGRTTCSPARVPALPTSPQPRSAPVLPVLPCEYCCFLWGFPHAANQVSSLTALSHLLDKTSLLLVFSHHLRGKRRTTLSRNAQPLLLALEGCPFGSWHSAL